MTARLYLSLAAVAGLGVAVLADVPPARAAGACLSMPLVFETETAQGCLDEDTLNRLMDAPLPIGGRAPGGSQSQGVELTAPDDATKQRVRTCRAYTDAVQAGYYAATQLDMNFEGFMRVACGSLLALAASDEAASSRIDDEAVGFQTLSLLPVDVLPALAPDTEDALASLKSAQFSVGSMVATGDVLTRGSSPEQLELAYAGAASTYGEVARGDFNGDGDMDILVYARHEAVNGSLRWYELFALSYPDQSLTFERFQPDGVDVLDPKP